MAKKRNHYIPRVLLARFASRRDGEKAWVWQITCGRRPIEVSVRNVGVAPFFYGRPETQVEDRLSEQESRLTSMLDSLEAGANPVRYDGDLRHWVHTLATRTRHLRDGFVDAATSLFDEMAKTADSECAQEAGRAYFEAHLDGFIQDMLARLPEDQRDQVLARLQEDPSKWVDLRRMIEQLVPQNSLGTLLKEFLSKARGSIQIDRAAKNGQIRGLAKLLSTSGDSPIVVDSWHIVRTDSSQFILGDCCTFGVDESGNAFPLLAELRGRTEVYVPLSKHCMAVGLRGQTAPSLTMPQINLAVARVSRDTVFAGALNPSILELSKVIGTASSLLGRESVDALVRDVWQDMRNNPRGERNNRR